MESLRQVKPVDVFQYDIDKPVSVKRGQSALVPFLNADFLGQPCALFNESLNAQNPMSVILFKNTFAITLDSGPLTIFDEDKCIGEAMVDSVPDGEYKFVAYGVERHIAVSSETTDALQPFHETEVVDGSVRLTRYRRYLKTYKFNHTGSINLDALYLEHRFRKGADYSLVDTPAPLSKTENFYRFFLQARAGEITTYTVQEQKLETETLSLWRISTATANNWLASGYIDRKVFDVLINETIPLQERLDKEQQAINKDEEELRAAQSKQSSAYNHLQSLTSSSYNRTVDMSTMNRVKEMLEQEETIRRLRAKLSEKKLAQKQANAELRTKITGIYYKAAIPLPKKD